jgi:hypothetical protein
MEIGECRRASKGTQSPLDDYAVLRRRQIGDPIQWLILITNVGQAQIPSDSGRMADGRHSARNA